MENKIKENFGKIASRQSIEKIYRNHNMKNIFLQIFDLYSNEIEIEEKKFISILEKHFPNLSFKPSHMFTHFYSALNQYLWNYFSLLEIEILDMDKVRKNNLDEVKVLIYNDETDWEQIKIKYDIGVIGLEYSEINEYVFHLFESGNMALYFLNEANRIGNKKYDPLFFELANKIYFKNDKKRYKYIDALIDCIKIYGKETQFKEFADIEIDGIEFYQLELAYRKYRSNNDSQIHKSFTSHKKFQL